MVYAMNSDCSLVSRKQLKTTRIQSETAKEISDYVRAHKISVQNDPSGKVIIRIMNNEKEVDGWHCKYGCH